MAPVKKKGWVNINPFKEKTSNPEVIGECSRVFVSQEVAEGLCPTNFFTAPIEWEE